MITGFFILLSLSPMEFTDSVFKNILNKPRSIKEEINEIKAKIYAAASSSNADIVITEIGGTTGDIESLPFLEAIRQVRLDLGYDNTEAGESVSNMDDESDFKEPDQDTVTDVDNLDKEEDKDQGYDKPLDQNDDAEEKDALVDNSDVPEDVLKDSNTQTDVDEN